MKADAQGDLMKRAQLQAAELFEAADQRYHDEARRSIQKQLIALLALFDAEVDVLWKDTLQPATDAPVAARPPELTPSSGATAF
jgi:hypothetical protein